MSWFSKGVPVTGPRVNPWALAAFAVVVLGIGGAIVYGMFFEKAAPVTQPPRMADEAIDTKVDTMPVIHHETPTPTPRPTVQFRPQAKATPSQNEIAAQQRRLAAYASAGVVGAFHSGSVLDVGRNGSVSGGNRMDTGQHGVGLEGPGSSFTGVGGRLEGPRSPFTIMAGGQLLAQLVDGIDTDLQGPIRGAIVEPVFNTLDHRHLLIPQGSTLIGKYEGKGTRVDVQWMRLILPDTSSMDLPQLPSDALDGYPGLADITDHHYGQRFALASVLGLVGIGSSLGSMGLTGGSAYGYRPSGAALMANAAGQGIGQNLSQEGQETLRENMITKPTNYIRPGYRFKVFVNADLSFPGGYGEKTGQGG